jgi:tetratricopeptide (TPR) repeat protein
VWISQGGVTRSPLPLPLLDDGVIEFRLAGTQEAARLVEFNIVYNSWLRRLTEANVVFDGKIRLIKELFAKGKEREAIVEGNELHTRMVEDATSLRDGLSKLQDQAGESGEIAKGKAALAAKQLERFTQQLSGFEEQLKEWEDPSPAARKVREGRIHEQTPDPVAAIEAYKEALKLDPSRAVASKRLKILQEAWEKKDPKLLEARTYIFETWPTITDSDQMELQLGKITDAIKAIKQHGDYVTALKLYRANVAHRERLLGIRQQLQPDVKDIDAAIEKQIDGLVEKINEMNDTALDLVEKSR